VKRRATVERRSIPVGEMKRRAAVERLSIPVGEMKLSRKKRKLPAAMMSYIKPRRKRRLLSAGVNLPSSGDLKSAVGDFPTKSAETVAAVKPAGAELTGRFTSASIVCRYRHLDRQRSQCRRMSSRISSAANGARPSTRSQTAAIMHRQLVVARMKSHEDTEAVMPQHGAELLSENCGATSTHSSSSHRYHLSPKSQSSEQHAVSNKRSSSKSVARRATLAVKKEVSDGDESERSMRRFIRRRNVETADTNRGSFDVVILFI